MLCVYNENWLYVLCGATGSYCDLKSTDFMYRATGLHARCEHVLCTYTCIQFYRTARMHVKEDTDAILNFCMVLSFRTRNVSLSIVLYN